MSEELEVSEQMGKLIPGEGPGPGTGGGGSSIPTSEIRRRNDAAIRRDREQKAFEREQRAAIRARAERGRQKLKDQGGAIKALDRLRGQASPAFSPQNDPNLVKTAPGIYRSKQAIGADKTLQQRLYNSPNNVKRRAAQESIDRMSEETEDARKDRRQERGGVDGNTRYDKPAKGIKKGPMTDEEKKKSKKAQKSAMDFVKAEIRAKYGKGAIMDTKKKK